jgi:pyruvate formate lyase activating enzyme
MARTELRCPVCNRTLPGLGTGVGVCPECIVDQWEKSCPHLAAVHASARKTFRLPPHPPKTPHGMECHLCFHGCHIGADELSYCGVRRGTEESMDQDGQVRARVSHYYDPLPTNCVADWVCPGGTGAGYPQFANERGPEVGFYNLAVFFEACNFNCLFCQNWSFRRSHYSSRPWEPIETITAAVNSKTSCICYFGGDPTPQIGFAIQASQLARQQHPNRILRICWETNGSAHPSCMQQMVELSLESGGCIKVDLKAWHPRIHQALCGCDNSRVLENFANLARLIPQRPEPPLLVASTLLVPGYVEADEIFKLATFIAGCNPDIPYSLLAFAPQFYMEDFPTTSRAQADTCYEAAVAAGLRRVHLGNRHLIDGRA